MVSVYLHGEDNAGSIDLKFKNLTKYKLGVGPVTTYQTNALSSDYLEGGLSIYPSDASGYHFGVELNHHEWMQPVRYYKLSIDSEQGGVVGGPYFFNFDETSDYAQFAKLMTQFMI